MMKILKLLKTWFVLSIFLLVLKGLSQEIEKSIYITANTWDISNTEVLSQIAKDSKSVQNPMLLILGNATPKKAFGNALDKQLQIIKGFKKDAIFLPGNHEWSNKGHRRVKDIEKHIKKNSKARFYPHNGEPIRHYEINENMVMITVDSQWFLEDWNKDTYINQETEIHNRTLFFLEFENQIKKAQGKIKIIPIHHPIKTYTRQVLIGNTAGPTVQDYQNKQYRVLRNRLKTIARQNEDIIFVSGHDKNLQYINNRVPHLVSGAAGTTKNVKDGGDGNFTTSKNGYARLGINTDGKVTAHLLTVQNGGSKSVFNTTVLEGGKPKTNTSFTSRDTFPKTLSASIYTKADTDKNGFYKTLWGNPIENSTVNL